MLTEQQDAHGRPLPLVIAHRGASAHAPENTLAAFRLACRAGAAMLETDVRRTSDGALVLLHDAGLARTTDGEGLVADLTLAEVQAADAGYRFEAEEGRHPWRGRGVQVPTLTQALHLLAVEFPSVRLNVEIKHDGEQPLHTLVDAVVRVVNAADASERVLLSSFSREIVSYLRAAHPRLDAALICGPDADLAACIAWAAQQRLVAVHPHHALLPHEHTTGAQQRTAAADMVLVTQRAGLALHVWTVNEPARMRELAGAGVSGIMTDDPDLLRLTLAG